MRRMRTVLPLACLGLAACTAPDAKVALDVSDPPGVSRLPAALLNEVTLGNETRRAYCVAPGTSFAVALEPEVRRVALSTGQREKVPAGLHFELSLEGESQPILQVPGAAGWTDHLVELGEPRERTLRFRVAGANPSAPGTEGAACWGSLVFLQDRLPGPPNVILVSLDTLGAPYLGSFGHEAGPSPRIDAFLAESFSFRRAYVQFANTLTSHRSIFTSRYPSRQSDASVPSLAEILSGHGYLNAGITEDAYVGSAYGFAHGFDRYVDGTGDPSTSVWGDAAGTFESAARWLETFGRRTRFFLFVHTYEVHSPYQPSTPESLALANRLTPGDERTFDGRELARWIIDHNKGLATVRDEDVRRLAALYTGEVRQLDGVVGRFLDDLERLGLADDTIVVITSDHGEAFGEDGMLGHGKSLHERVLHVPLGFRWPGRIAPGASDAVVQSVDLLPTLLALTGVPRPGDVDGRDLSPLLLGRVRDLAPLPAYAEMKARKTRGPTRPGSPACVGGAHAVFSERFKLFSCRNPAYELLFDLEADPGETRDVKDTHPVELERLRAFLRAYAEKAAPARQRDGDRNIDARTRERLRALGYVD